MIYIIVKKSIIKNIYNYDSSRQVIYKIKTAYTIKYKPFIECMN